ncbi:MAG: metallophosphoesterase, partial [Sporichthyaceae bacterium]|nr:metallophosphoesterase [Sporichthyaceae bacterium]
METVVHTPTEEAIPFGPRRSSRGSVRDAGWECDELGEFQSLIPEGSAKFSWLRPSVLWASRNDVLAHLLGDPAHSIRRRWVNSQRARGVDPQLRIDRTDLAGAEFSFLLLGDPGEGDMSQYAVVPGMNRIGAGTAFTILCSDVVYPTGVGDDYGRKFFQPYQAYPAPMYAVPGNHDWYDGLGGFMRVFCDAPALEPLAADDPEYARPRRFSRAWLRERLWSPTRAIDEELLSRSRGLRGQPGQQAHQPGPYWVLDAGPLRIVGIDTGIAGDLDAEQGDWLRAVSADPRPKILITGKPIYARNAYSPCPIEGGGTVDDIVCDPAHNYLAAIGGDIHNYQRYPVRVGDRVIQYIVAGGGGAFMHATHTIRRISVRGVAEDEFRCYPLRGDSLSFYSKLYDQRLGLGGLLVIPPDQAAMYMSKRVKNLTPRVGHRDVKLTIGTRIRAAILSGLPVERIFQRWFSEFSDWDTPPFFKSFLQVSVSPTALRIRCFAATGCHEHEL